MSSATAGQPWLNWCRRNVVLARLTLIWPPTHCRMALPQSGCQPPANGWCSIIGGGYSTGADSIDLTETVHPSYRQVAEQVYQAIPGLGLCGVDIIATDWSQPATADNHIVVEVNSRPAIGAHHFPWEGKPRDVAGAIVDACLNSIDEKAAPLATRAGMDCSQG